MDNQRIYNRLLACFSINLMLTLLLSSVTLLQAVVSEQPDKQNPSEVKNNRHHHLISSHSDYHAECSTLLPGQFLCLDLNIDPLTQQPKDCSPVTQRANVTCEAAPGIICHSTGNSSFTSTIPCKATNGYSYETALLLSVFLGMFGLDRFYLGYHAIGLAKLSTLGFLFLGQLIDVVLIATQTLGPADGSHYVISYYGAAINIVTMDNDTYKMPQPDWQPDAVNT